MSNIVSSSLRSREQTNLLAAIAMGMQVFPHLRIGQLIDNAVSTYRDQPASTLFYISDLELTASINNYIKEFGRSQT